MIMIHFLIITVSIALIHSYLFTKPDELKDSCLSWSIHDELLHAFMSNYLLIHAPKLLCYQIYFPPEFCWIKHRSWNLFWFMTHMFRTRVLISEITVTCTKDTFFLVQYRHCLKWKSVSLWNDEWIRGLKLKCQKSLSFLTCSEGNMDSWLLGQLVSSDSDYSLKLAKAVVIVFLLYVKMQAVNMHVQTITLNFVREEFLLSASLISANKKDKSLFPKQWTFPLRTVAKQYHF